jgi:competence protein ComEA
MDQSAAPWRVLEDPVDEATLIEGPGSPNRAWIARWTPVAAIALAAALAVAAVGVATSGSSPSVAVTGADPEGSAGVDASGAPGAGGPRIGRLLLVDVQGAVLHPGVVRVVAGSRIGDAIAAAGGYGPRVDAARVAASLNLAAALKDGDQVVVPSRDDQEPRTSPTASGSAGGHQRGGSAAPVDLNTATAEQLDALPGIGPVTAAKILAARDEQRFATVDDLRSRKLVGAATFDKIKDLVAVP